MAGFWDSVRQSVSNVLFTPRVTHLGWPGGGEMAASLGIDPLTLSPGALTAAHMWRTQPHLRTVVSFRARNVAQLGLHVFERVSDTDRRRDHASPLATALRRPDPLMTSYDLIFSLVGDLDLYDRAYWLLSHDRDTGLPQLRRMPPSWVEPVFKDPFTITDYRVVQGSQYVTVPASSVLAFTGYSPVSPVGASPTVEALRETLKEQIEAAAYRAQIWKRGGRVSSVIERPAGAREWSDGAREAFREDWYAKYTGNGSKAGGTPILEEGMQLKRIDFNAQEQQFVEAAKLALNTVASAFHISPAMIGQTEQTNYANIRELHRMLYGDSLGPLLAQIEARINTFLLPMMGMDPDRHYVEFNLAEKLKGSFEEQAAVMQTLVGAPVMTRNEGRGRFNLPQVDGGDDLVVPLNVLVGGQASPTDSGSQNRTSRQVSAKSGEVRVKATVPDAYRERVAGILSDFFTRQGRTVTSRLGAGAEDWWDEQRWNEELAEDLQRVAVLVSTYIGEESAEALGFSAGDYNVDRTLNFLKAVSERVAGDVNATTLAAIQEGIEGIEGGTLEAAEHVYAVAEESRASLSALTFGTLVAGFAAVEAGKQLAGSRATKTWVVNSSNPRASHASMNGETVGIEENFSNQMPWPGSIEGGVDEVAGCVCSLVVSVP